MRQLSVIPPLIFLAGMMSVGGFFVGCHSKADQATMAGTLNGAAAGDARMVRTELYFGLSRKGGVEIPAEAFAAFVGEVVTPRFPDGFTIVDAFGQWRDASGKISRESSKLLIVLHDASARDAQAIEEIRDQYKSRFGQESVMRVTSTAGVSF